MALVEDEFNDLLGHLAAVHSRQIQALSMEITRLRANPEGSIYESEADLMYVNKYIYIYIHMHIYI